MTGAVDLAAAVARARVLAAGPVRRVLGVAGPPGAGKSTLAGVLADALGPSAALVPMDGFHLADVQLRRLGRLGRKGAPDTFDADGYVALLRRLRSTTCTVYAPAFDRSIDQPVAASIAVGPQVRLVLTEGNYLLLDDPPWNAVRDLLDECWWVDTDPSLRRDRLVARHVRFGKSPAQARAFVTAVDEVNARAVEATAAGAQLRVRLS